MTTVVNIHEAKSSLSKLLERVESGERVTIARAGRPIADLVAHKRADIVFGTAKGMVLILDDETFDDVDDDIVAMFEGS